MRRCHVRIDGGVSPLEQTSGMGGDAAATMEYLYRRCRETHIHFLASEPERCRVIVAGDLDVIVDADTGDLPFGELIAICWQRFECRAVEFDERAVWRHPGNFFERRRVSFVNITLCLISKLTGEYYCRFSPSFLRLKPFVQDILMCLGRVGSLDDEYAGCPEAQLTVFLNDEQPPIFGMAAS